MFNKLCGCGKIKASAAMYNKYLIQASQLINTSELAEDLKVSVVSINTEFLSLIKKNIFKGELSIFDLFEQIPQFFYDVFLKYDLSGFVKTNFTSKNPLINDYLNKLYNMLHMIAELKNDMNANVEKFILNKVNFNIFKGAPDLQMLSFEGAFKVMTDDIFPTIKTKFQNFNENQIKVFFRNSVNLIGDVEKMFAEKMSLSDTAENLQKVFDFFQSKIDSLVKMKNHLIEVKGLQYEEVQTHVTKVVNDAVATITSKIKGVSATQIIASLKNVTSLQTYHQAFEVVKTNFEVYKNFTKTLETLNIHLNVESLNTFRKEIVSNTSKLVSMMHLDTYKIEMQNVINFNNEFINFEKIYNITDDVLELIV